MKPIIIAIAGGSASGKTTVVNEIVERLPNESIQVISFDDYYNDFSKLSMEERNALNFDHPDNFDNNLLKQNLLDLIDGKTIQKPLYDFVIHNRKKEMETISPSKIIIIEGILALHNEDVRDLADIKIFVKCDEDIRFIRRLKRDVKERGRSVDSVINQYLDTVKPSFNTFVRPSSKYADLIIPNDNKHDVALEFIVSRIKDILGEE